MPKRLLSAVWNWLDDRTGIGGVISHVFDHPVPGDVVSKRGWIYVLGIATLTAFVVQVLTGIALVAMYIPSTDDAYDSLIYITENATFGNVIRGMHYFGASAMLVLITFHMLRTFITGSYKFPREMNWITGAILFGLTVAMAFTGMLLRWDHDSLGSVFIATEQAGRFPVIGEPLARLILAGETITATTLSRFYALHVFILPGLIIALIVVHFILVLRHGVSELPKTGEPVEPSQYRQRYEKLLQETGQNYWPFAIWREVVFALGVVLVIAGLAIVLGPRPLGREADPALTGEIPRPDWYFAWYQAFLESFPRPLGDFMIVLVPIVGGAFLILLPLLANRGERSPARRPWAVGGVIILGVGFGVFMLVGIRAPFVPDFRTEPLAAEAVGGEGSRTYEGYQVFFRYGCQYCHAVMGRGGRYGPDLTTLARRLPREHIAFIVLTGRGDMPAYRGILTEADAEALLDFLAELDGTPLGIGAGGSSR